MVWFATLKTPASGTLGLVLGKRKVRAGNDLFAGGTEGVSNGIDLFEMMVHALWPNSAMSCHGSCAVASCCWMSYSIAQDHPR